MNILPIVKTAGGHADIFSNLLENRIIFLTDGIDRCSASTVIAQLLYLEAACPGKDIYLYINSPGGSVSDGLAITDTMDHITSDVVTVATGTAASMGAVILSAGAKGKRCILKNSEVLIHQPLIFGSLDGQCSDIAIQSDHILATRNKLEEFLAERTGQSKEKIHFDCERDYYLTAKQAVEYGLCDKIV